MQGEGGISGIEKRMNFLADRAIVEAASRHWVMCLTCNRNMHVDFLTTHECGDPTPALDDSRFQSHVDVLDEDSMEQARRDR